MFTAGRVVVIALMTLLFGFVGGVWSISTGVFEGMLTLAQAPPPTPLVVAGPAAAPLPIPPPEVGVAQPPNWLTGTSNSLGPISSRVDLLPSPGCQWEIEPRPFEWNRLWQLEDKYHAIAAYASLDTKDNTIRVLLARTYRATSQAKMPALRVVLFDREANRYLSRQPILLERNGNLDVVDVEHFRREASDAIADPQAIAFIGVEQVPAKAEIHAIAAAQSAAKERNLAILPPPRIGEPYPFDLPTVDGKRIRSQDLLGKAVILGVWGDGPGGGMLPLMMKGTQDACPTGEVAVVSVSFRATPELAQKPADHLQTDFATVHVPNDPTTRRIWTEGAQLTWIPSLFLIDREGILRYADIGTMPHDLTARVDNLFGRPFRFPLTPASFVGPLQFPLPWLRPGEKIVGPPSPKVSSRPLVP